jgi:hypothetical protein
MGLRHGAQVLARDRQSVIDEHNVAERDADVGDHRLADARRDAEREWQRILAVPANLCDLGCRLGYRIAAADQLDDAHCVPPRGIRIRRPPG